MGLLMFVAEYGPLFWAEKYVPSGVASVLAATLPLITIVLEMVVFRQLRSAVAIAGSHDAGLLRCGRAGAAGWRAALWIAAVFCDSWWCDGVVVGIGTEPLAGTAEVEGRDGWGRDDAGWWDTAGAVRRRWERCIRCRMFRCAVGWRFFI